jgi:peptidoglycan/xylan/chitin deacetylase (PgdA/CDA1 family)
MCSQNTFLLFILLLISNVVCPQLSTDRVWKNKRCAIALTYDDGLNCHIENVIPELDSVGFKATFYIIPSRNSVSKRINDWKNVASKGHELGNHTLFHPCMAIAEGRDYTSWVSPEYDLNNYSIKRIVDEIKMANSFLNIIDEKKNRTIAYPCGDCIVNDSSYIPYIKDELSGGRGNGKYSDIVNINTFQIPAISITDSYSERQIIEMVDDVLLEGKLLVFLFHGVGGEHNSNVSTSKHSALLKHIKKNENDIWVAPLVEIVDYIKSYRSIYDVK